LADLGIQGHKINWVFSSKEAAKDIGHLLKHLLLSLADLVGVQPKLFAQLSHCLVLTQRGRATALRERGRAGIHNISCLPDQHGQDFMPRVST
jgi:hypothetical protein